MNLRNLIVNADDIGMSRGITDGIIFAHKHGIVTSTSMMVNQPASEYAVEQLSKAPSLGVGIHLNLDQGMPLLAPELVPSLVDEGGRFYPERCLNRRLWRGQVATTEMEAELSAQIRWMKQRGIVPTHADSHHHIHFYPHAAKAFARACAAENIRCIRCARVRHYPRNGYLGGPHAGRIYRRLLVTLYMELIQVGRFRKLRFPQCRVEADPIFDRESSLALGWKLALENLPEGQYELVCHPGFTRGEGENGDFPGYALRRELELRILTDPSVRKTIEHHGIALITYSQLD